jgi:hypothetical protein
MYGFGAFRCAIDNLNGDNIEWIGYPSGYRHVYCYYYAVIPPPENGTIVVQKQLAGAADSVTFPFQGNVSYNNTPYQGAFDITTSSAGSGSITFVRGATRAGEAEWDFRERPVTGWNLDSVSCSSQLGDPAQGGSTITQPAPNTPDDRRRYRSISRAMTR